ncbi:RNA-directed DNA polymerase from mobile element jockey-like, partial [Brachionus plicatilis]
MYFITQLVDTKKQNGLVVLGDFNFSDILWSNLGGTCNGKGRNSSIAFLDTLSDNYLYQLTLLPTFGANTLDLVLCDDSTRIFQVNIGPHLSCSSKNILHYTLNFDYHLNTHLPAPEYEAKRIYSKGNYMDMITELNLTDWYTLFENLTTEEAFLQKYNKLVEKHIPVIHVSKSFRFKKAIPKWSNPQIKKITKEKFKLFSKLRAASKSAAIILRSAYKKKCYEAKKLVAETVLSYEKKIARQCKSNPKLLYSYINDQKKCKDKIRYLVDGKGKQLINEEDIANCLNEAFYNSFNTVT